MLLSSKDNTSHSKKINKYSLIGINSISPSYVSSISHIKLIDKNTEQNYSVKIIENKIKLIKMLFQIPHFVEDFILRFNQTKTSIIKIKFLFELSKYISDSNDVHDNNDIDNKYDNLIDSKKDVSDLKTIVKKKHKKNIFNNIHDIMNNRIKLNVIKIQELLNRYKSSDDINRDKYMSEIGDIFCNIHINEKYVKDTYRNLVDAFDVFESENSDMTDTKKNKASILGMPYSEIKKKYIDIRDVYRSMLTYTEKMILANLRLVISVSKRYTNKKIDFMDIVQEGNLGLIKAIKKFDYTKGYKFSTYATWWIQQSITRDIYDNYEAVRIPIHMKENISKIHKSCMSINDCLSYDEKIKEISKITSLDEKKIKKVFKIQRGCVNIDKLSGIDMGDEDIVDVIDKSGSKSPFSHVLVKDKIKIINSLIDNNLNEREAKIFRMRYLEKSADNNSIMTLEIIGYMLNITRERVRQILNNAQAKLNKAVETNGMGHLFNGMF